MNQGLARVLACFDIYSPRPIARVVSWSTLLIGVGLLLAGSASHNVLGIIPLLLLLWCSRHRFLDTVEELLARQPWLVIALPFLIFASKFVASPPVARDDLLRHVVAAFWPNGYQDMYVQLAEGVVIGHPYVGFDWFAGSLASVISPAGTMWCIQALAWLAFVWVFSAAGFRLQKGGDRGSVLVLVALLVSLHVMSERLFLARPEVFLGIWALAGAAVSGRRGGGLWLISGLLLSTTYYLAPIYFLSVLLLPFSRQARVGTFAGLSLCWLLFWVGVEGGRLPSLLLRPLAALAAQDDAMRVSENLSILHLLIHPTMLALLLLALHARHHAADTRLFALAGYFGLSNQVRFGGVIAPLLALYALSGRATQNIVWPRHARVFAVVLASFALSLASLSVPRYGSLPRFQLTEGAVVLTAFDEAGYSLLFENPGRIQVAPIFDVGMVAPAAQKVVSRLAKGELDCASAQAMGFSHLVERSLVGAPPACATLLEVQGGWRLWRFR